MDGASKAKWFDQALGFTKDNLGDLAKQMVLTRRLQFSGLYDFGARFYDSFEGRFAVPDAPGADQYPLAPQSWNLYSYVRNSPLINVDPTGRECRHTLTKDGSTETVDDGTKPYCHELRETATSNAGLTLVQMLLGPQVHNYPADDVPLDPKAQKIMHQVALNMNSITPCGGGIYAFGGPAVKVPGTKLHGEVLGLLNVDFNEGVSVNGLAESPSVGPLAVGGELGYSFADSKVHAQLLGLPHREFAGEKAGPKRRGYKGVKDAVKLGAIGGGVLLDPSKGEFGAFVSFGPVGGGAYVSLTCNGQ